VRLERSRAIQDREQPLGGGRGEHPVWRGGQLYIANLVPSDIEIRGNHIYKPWRWKVSDPRYGGTHWAVKNLVELKAAQRVWIVGNRLENCWTDGQVGYAVLMTPRCGGNPWNVVADVTLEYNVILGAESGITMSGYDGLAPSPGGGFYGLGARIAIRNNWLDLGNAHGDVFAVCNGVQDVTIDHNSAHMVKGRSALIFTGNKIPGAPSAARLVVTNNVWTGVYEYPVAGPGVTNAPQAFASCAPDTVFTGNVLAGVPAAQIPAGNAVPADAGGVVGTVSHDLFAALGQF
jgi:hypothetical protein